MTYGIEKNELLPIGRKIEIQGILPGHDLYNITAPFEIGDTTYILGREESKEHARNSKVVWIKNINGIWKIDRSIPSIIGEDPCITQIKNEEGEVIETIVGVVKVVWTKKVEEDGTVKWEGTWKTNFYRGKNLRKLKKSIKDEKFLSGPKDMKDIRLIDLDNGRVGVFTRPLNNIYGRGKIGYIELNSLDDLNEENLLKAEIIEVAFSEGEWGGVNEVHDLKDGRFGVLGHIANKAEDGTRHYRAITFIFDPKTKRVSEQHEIATSDDFPSGEAKNSSLQDVIFSGGLKRHGNGKATLYVGLRDKEAASIEIEDPFI